MSIDETANETAGMRREYALSGLDGGNLLGFLAALGTLKAVSELAPGADWRMRWTDETGPWRPVLAGAVAWEPDDLVVELAGYLAGTSNRVLYKDEKTLNIPAATFRNWAIEAQESATADDRRYADYIAAFGCENAVAGYKRGQPIQLQHTPLSATSGRQQFLGTIRETVDRVKPDQLHRSLFEQWQRNDEKWGLRWDPAEYRSYALRWDNPAKKSEVAKTERGANRLAVEALPLLPTAISRAGGLQTTGFKQPRNSDEPRISWPIWICSINIDAVASVLRLDELQTESPSWRWLTRLGIAAVYRSYKFKVGKNGEYGNFTPGVPV